MRKGSKTVTKARIFLYEHAQIYYREYGIDPDKHFDRMCKKYGTQTAVKIIDRNMEKAFEKKWKKDKEMEEREEREQRILETECPF